MSNFDPLAVECDWDDSEAIAYAVARAARRHALEEMHGACADLLLDRIVKIREGRYGAMSRQEKIAQTSVLELMLARFGVPNGCEWWKRQEGEERIEYRSPIDMLNDQGPAASAGTAQVEPSGEAEHATAPAEPSAAGSATPQPPPTGDGDLELAALGLEAAGALIEARRELSEARAEIDALRAKPPTGEPTDEEVERLADDDDFIDALTKYWRGEEGEVVARAAIKALRRTT